MHFDLVSVLWLVLATGAAGLLYGLLQTMSLLKADAGNDRMREIAAAIQEGASAYLKRQYTTIGIVGVVIAGLAYWKLGALAAGGFVIGAVLSGAAGFAGMLISVRANVRTAQAASVSLAAGLKLAFGAGAVTGMFVAGGALLGVAGYFAFLTLGLGLEPTSRDVVDALVALGFGASLISIFARRRHGRQGRSRHPRRRPQKPRDHRR
jgi:K(+)-stimulated pyrophosphate-energized sodium pump